MTNEPFNSYAEIPPIDALRSLLHAVEEADLFLEIDTIEQCEARAAREVARAVVDAHAPPRPDIVRRFRERMEEASASRVQAF